MEEKNYRQVCYRCRRPEVACFCKDLKSIDTHTRFVILMHPKEAKKEKVGTGRLSHVLLKNSEIIVGENFDDNEKVQSLINDSENACMILYPGNDSHNITNEKLTITKKLIIFIIDGTWPCAKSMMRDSKTLHLIPKISFDNSCESLFKIKQQPAKYCLSTIESLFYLIQGLKKSDLENNELQNEVLLEGLNKIVEFQIACANDPKKSHYRKKGGYKAPSLRAPSKKHLQRKVVFDPLNYY